MKKTFTVKGHGINNQTTDTCRKHIEACDTRIKELEWDLENWYDTPKWRIEKDIRAFKKTRAMWEEILSIAIERGWDEEI